MTLRQSNSRLTPKTVALPRLVEGPIARCGRCAEGTQSPPHHPRGFAHHERAQARRRVCGLPTLWSWTTRGPGRGALGSGPQATTTKRNSFEDVDPRVGHD